MMNKFFVSFLVSVFFFLTACSQALNVQKLDSLFNILASRGLATGSIAISINGQIEYQKAIGFASINADKKTIPGIHTRYRIGSATKMFTAVMIFQLIEEGKMSLTGRLNEYFPGLPNADRITIQDMLYHRSGLHDYTKETDFQNWLDKHKTQEEMLTIIREKGSDFKPGTQADYSNTNYLLLGYIIEKVCNISYAHALKRRIISKLELKNTSYGSNIDNNEAYSYKYAESNWQKQKATDLSIHGGAGSIVSIPADLVSFLNAIFAYKLVSKKSVEQM
jgi:D-alanyl-D-alanine carboxypeptidase